MEKTWASGAIELLRHADSHIDLDSAFDKRIAFISIDNCVETAVRTFLSLPESKSGIKVTRGDFESAASSFPKLVSLVFALASDRLPGLDPGDVEHYHRIRNRLYHEGTGLSVDEQYLVAYRSIAVVLLESLFDVSYAKHGDERSQLDALILNWNRIDHIVRSRIKDAGIDYAHTYKWEEAVQAGVLHMDMVQDLTELRMARNRLVHSTDVDSEDVAHWVRKSRSLLAALDVSDGG